MTEAIRIVPAAPADAEAIRALVVAAYGHYVERMGKEPGPMRADAAALVASGDVTLAWRGDALVGMIAIRMQADAVTVGNVAVAPSEQGNGLGSHLLALAEQRAIDAGIPLVRLFTNARMTENLAYYPRRGYVETHRATDGGFDRVFFEKRL